MKASHSIFILILFVFLLGCKAKMDVEMEKSNPLEGTTWELTSGKTVREDTTFTFPNSPYDKWIIIFGKTHYSIVSQDTSRKSSFSVLAKYTIDGDNVTATYKMFPDYEVIGKSINWKIQIEGDQLIFKATEVHLGGIDWKENHEVYKRID